MGGDPTAFDAWLKRDLQTKHAVVDAPPPEILALLDALPSFEPRRPQ